MRLTSVEKSILRELETNARITFSSIGKLIRCSEQRVSYNVNSMIEKGIIKGFYANIDYARLNTLLFRVFFKVNYIAENKFSELIRYLVKEDTTALVESCGGGYDLLCTFFTQNPSRFNKTLKGIMEVFPEQLKNYTVLTTIVIRNFGRKFLFKSSAREPKESIIGGDREISTLDSTDLKILSMISSNARINAVEIANNLSITSKTVISRIRLLEAKEIITSYKPILNLQRVNFITSKLVIKYHNVSSELENQLVNYLKVHPNVYSVVKTLGEWDMEIEIETEDMKE
ncbi:MAG: Lrp/AsnC family transcriptional regulator, partial [Nanoarchaeota archaeon]|nr:Lrp/AsnC family transcriptional regulator [Nanoarchaeota archaeon]